MPEKTQEQLIQETHQGLYGVKDTDDKGLIGDVREIKDDVKNQNRRITKLEGAQKRLYGMIMGAGLAGGGTGAAISALFGG